MRNATKKTAATKKPPAKKAPASKKTVAKKAAGTNSSGVRIRMYRPGLGDCWLLTFSNKGKDHHVLIDCGVFIGTPKQKETLVKIAKHVRHETKDQLSAWVATHEHWDHVAGFFYAKDEFKDLKTNEVWLAWTEDPEQTIAKENKKHIAAVKAAVSVAVTRMMASGSAYDRECGLAAARVAEFSGGLGAAFSERSDEAMDFVTAKRKAGDKFLKPGDVLERDWVPGGLRIYVLSPPMDRDALRQDRTPIEEGFKDEKKKTHMAAAEGWAAAVMAGANDSFDGSQMIADRLRPFDVSLAWPEQDVFQPSTEAVKDARGKREAVYDLVQRYRDVGWRRVDNDWLQSAASLALQLDKSINNTSLVLAFELAASGKVLLFAGDSELESWKSWQGRTFNVDGKVIKAEDLLARTVFYKVGHHGSGNATLRAGLARMTSPDLVAAVPTDTDFARDKQGWDMPAAKLGPALKERAKGRVLYADPGKSSIRENNPEGISAERWKKFMNSIDERDDLFVDYRVD